LLNRVFKGFQYRDFRIMWIGACTSSVGTWMQSVAQNWLVFQLSGSSFFLGLDNFLGNIPIVLFSLVGGVLADRIERRKILLGSQFVQLMCAFLLAALFALGIVHVWHILILSFIVGTAQSFGGPAYSALIPTLVKTEDLPNAIALNSIQFNLARVIGPMLGGLALAYWGATWCFSMNGLSFIAVIISLLIIRPHFTPNRGKESVLESMQQGCSRSLSSSFCPCSRATSSREGRSSTPYSWSVPERGRCAGRSSSPDWASSTTRAGPRC